jgi:simple sugar transport system permease protein
VVHRLQGSISPGYGYTGIIIAWLAKLNPFGVIVASILFGGLLLAGREIQPSGVPRLIQGIILFMLIASEVVLRYRIRIERVKSSFYKPASPPARYCCLRRWARFCPSAPA